MERDGHSGEIYIGTILPEVNRWTAGRAPTYRVSEWVERFRADTFDGMELWENHALLAPPEEQAALAEAAEKFPVAVFSAYVSFDEAGAPGREAVARMAGPLNARAVKFNLGGDLSARDAEIARAREWRQQFAPGVRLLSECHAGTYMETPALAAEALSRLGEGFYAIVHPFLETPESLREWFRALGPRIVHAHVQMRDEEGRPLRLSRQPDEARAILDVMREAGYAGSFTLEFTEGTTMPHENAESLYRAALDDLSFLRVHWTRPSGAL
jgi:sugar phosphate isomerase/epimerase